MLKINNMPSALVVIPTFNEIENIERIINKSVCNSCFNNFKLDAGDWDWCPIWKGTDKQHICAKSISPLTVFNKLKI